MPQRLIDPNAARWVVQALGRLACTMALLIGAAIIWGGDIRFSGPSYASALTYPGAPESWGIVIGLAGLVGLLGSLLSRLWLTRWSLYTITAWCLFFTITLIQAAAHLPNAGLTGPFVYLYFAVSAAVLGAAHHRMG